MEPLIKQLQALPFRMGSMSATGRVLLALGLLAAGALLVAVNILSRGGTEYQYAFTNLTTEDGTEASALLKTGGIPFRLDAQGTALAVPGDRVYEARMVLATAGLPRGGGVGFELFDRGDLGVSEFTQRVNLRRAIEGELARTIGRLSGVRSARVTVSLAEKGLYRDEDKKPSASVMVNLQPGRTLGDKELAGIKHLTASSVPGLAPDSVTIIDGRGGVLSSEGSWESGENGFAKRLERDYEQRIQGLLEPVVGAGNVIAKVSATVDQTLVNTSAEVFDPDQTALKSERKVTSTQNQKSTTPSAIAGAAANVPLAPTPGQAAATNQNGSDSQDEVRNFEVSKTVTNTVSKAPRLQRLSVAIVLDGVDGKPRAAEEVTRLGELAKRAVGFDAARGDQLDISSSNFGRSSDAPVPETKVEPAKPPVWLYAAIGAGGLLLVVLMIALIRPRSSAVVQSSPFLLTPGSSVSQIEAEATKVEMAQKQQQQQQQGMAPAEPGKDEDKGPQDPLVVLRDKAKSLASTHPDRAALLIRSWLQPEGVSHD